MKNSIKGYTKRFLNKTSMPKENKRCFTIMDTDVKFEINGEEFYLSQMLEEIDSKLDNYILHKWAGIVIAIALSVPSGIAIYSLNNLNSFRNSIVEQNQLIKEQEAKLVQLQIEAAVLRNELEHVNK
jgi:uncharacterized protein YycO